jgi:uncharacterized protein (DUF433 family)/transposase-like protein
VTSQTKTGKLQSTAAIEVPRYSIPEVARYVRMSPETLRSWVQGRTYPTKGGTKATTPMITRPRSGDARLSYANLVEAYVLHALRKALNVPMPAIRDGIEYVELEFGIRRFLLSDKLRARQGNLLIEHLGQLINVGQGGQAELRDLVQRYLQRIDYADGLPSGLYPLTRPNRPEGPKRIVIFPDVGFGRPVTQRRFISTSAIVDRFEAGESVEDLAEDYDLEPVDIEEAIRIERHGLAA